MPSNLKYPSKYLLLSIRGYQRMSSAHMSLYGISEYSNHRGRISAETKCHSLISLCIIIYTCHFASIVDQLEGFFLK